VGLNECDRRADRRIDILGANAALNISFYVIFGIGQRALFRASSLHSFDHVTRHQRHCLVSWPSWKWTFPVSSRVFVGIMPPQLQNLWYCCCF